jgi:hypothetical protein
MGNLVPSREHLFYESMPKRLLTHAIPRFSRSKPKCVVSRERSIGKFKQGRSET